MRGGAYVLSGRSRLGVVHRLRRQRFERLHLMCGASISALHCSILEDVPGHLTACRCCALGASQVADSVVYAARIGPRSPGWEPTGAVKVGMTTALGTRMTALDGDLLHQAPGGPAEESSLIAAVRSVAQPVSGLEYFPDEPAVVAAVAGWFAAAEAVA